jgi:purine catabolism regulator
MPLTLRELLAFDVLRDADPEVIAGEAMLDRVVRWVHSSEIYEIGPLLAGGELLLTTGLGLAGTDAGARRHYVREIAAAGVTGVALELGRTFSEVPRELADEARRQDLPFILLRMVVPFIRITEVANTRIVCHSEQALAMLRVGGPPSERDREASALLSDLVEGTLSQGVVRAKMAGFHPGTGQRLVGVAAAADEPAALAVLDHAALVLRTPVLRGRVGGLVLGVLAVPRGVVDAVGAVHQAVAEAQRRLGGTEVRVAVGHAATALGDLGASLRDARAALSLRPSATLGSARTLALDLELTRHGDTAHLHRLVRRTINPLVAWDSAHRSDLVRTLEIFLLHGCSATRTAAALHLGRQSFYQRLQRIETLLGYTVTDPDVHASLLLATTAHRLRETA